MDRMLPMKEAMIVAGIRSRNTMKRLINEGILDAERIPTPSGLGDWRISENSLRSIFESKIRTQAIDHLRRIRA